MKGLGILSLRWVCAAVLGAAFVLPQGLHGQGPAQGIKVHGHWVIEVRNSDGTLQLRREFENALTTAGQRALGQLLSGQRTADSWIVNAGSSVGASDPCVLSTGARGPCVVEETTGPVVSPPAFKSLTKSFASGNDLELVLQGSFEASNDGTVSYVQTSVYTHLRDGTGAFGFAFTSTNLASPIPVQATQTVSVTVTFTFS